MTPLERAARALEEHLVCGTIRRGEYKDAVRAVLTAIREPSEAMSSAYFDVLEGKPMAPDTVFPAMIDAALAEGAL